MMEGVRNKNTFLLKSQGNGILHISLVSLEVLPFTVSVFKLFVTDSALLFIFFFPQFKGKGNTQYSTKNNLGLP